MVAGKTTGAGNDTISHFEKAIATNSKDTFKGGVSGTELDGYGNIDTADYSTESALTVTLNDGADTINDGAKTDSLINIEKLILSNNDDTINVATQSAYDEVSVDAGNGSDTLHSTAVDLTLNATTTNVENIVLDAGAKNIDVSAVTTALHITANADDNVIMIDSESDTIDALGGTDTLKLNNNNLNLANINYSNIEIIDVNNNDAKISSAKLDGKTLSFKGTGKVEFDAGASGANNYAGISSSLSPVVLNLLNNAKDALKAQSNKIIRLQFLTNTYGLEIECCDNGPGIDTKIKDKIFHPYFTTKDKTQGTGIGLYMSREIVSKIFHGKIHISSRAESRSIYYPSSNKGKTCFFIAVPYSQNCIKEELNR